MKQRLPLLLVLLASLLLAAGALAQNEVSDDEVNAVARGMYCPICENEPLSDCRTQTCLEWKEEIRRQLGEGHDPDDIIDYFVALYGQSVVGIPRDPLLRALSLFVPPLLALLLLAGGLFTFWRWRARPPASTLDALVADEQEAGGALDDDEYRGQIEQDLS